MKRLWDVFAAFLGCLGRSWDALGESEGPQVEDKSSKNRVSKSSLKNLRIEMRWAQRKPAVTRVPGSREIRPACKGESPRRVGSLGCWRVGDAPPPFRLS